MTRSINVPDEFIFAFCKECEGGILCGELGSDRVICLSCKKVFGVHRLGLEAFL
ncbi:MAG: hypothetical protein GKS07_07405 [Nitrosopumilus sp.]|nr:MAG: hypothetical protein GKS07_07405 [Nitrosopumilus sp.]